MNYWYGNAVEDDIPVLAPLLGQALHFNMTREALVEWMQKRGVGLYRAFKVDGTIAAGLGILPMGQWFGGKAQPTAGITVVGVGPEWRGRKVGGLMMEAMLREQYEQDVAISTLYPATTQFYRTLGYERAGSRILYQLNPSLIKPKRDHGVTLRQVLETDYAPFAAIYDPWAASQAGVLERSQLMWERVMVSPRAERLRYILSDQAGQAVGYVVYEQAGQFEDVKVIDWVATTGAALDALLDFWAGHRSLVSKIVLPGAPIDPLLFRYHEQGIEYNWHLDWMLRIINAPLAIQRRGFPRWLNCEIALDLIDPRLDWNHGRWVLQLRDGVGRLERGGNGAVSLHVRDLAALYSGYLAPHDLRLAGSLQADAEQLGLLAAIFASPRPWMSDMF
ncbi:GNAT family N-acetyltransferase [Herpetosiphon sp.]|uniref:GCN5-related N-acetyltransferase n=1 Tax=Herpetosiphon aurantiacus (strain ATCC 23779 / DSM 785 / 114-95) TaxID=316274 RepID=A9AYC4_HERA2|nr:GNAT family N-acetyltransferase [Herpetosiphon sp.]ABX03506.1 GCN5-related N-acetyltransferase [Herpetosiphon aurantiacus DSM 785]